MVRKWPLTLEAVTFSLTVLCLISLPLKFQHQGEFDTLKSHMSKKKKQQQKPGRISLGKSHGRVSKNTFNMEFSLEMLCQKSYSWWGLLGELGSYLDLLL